MYKQLFVILVGAALSNALPPEDKFIKFDVYKIENRQFTDGVLSVDTGIINEQGTMNSTAIPKVSVWTDSAGQKWRLDTHKLYSGFMLRPTSYESFVLEQDESSSFLQWVGSITRMDRHKLWYLNAAGNNFTQIKNRLYETCLSASATDVPIQAVPCTNSFDQQWHFIKL